MQPIFFMKLQKNTPRTVTTYSLSCPVVQILICLFLRDFEKLINLINKCNISSKKIYDILKIQISKKITV